MRGQKSSIQVFRLATQLSNVTDAVGLHLQYDPAEWPAMTYYAVSHLLSLGPQLYRDVNA